MADFTVELINPKELQANPLNWRRHPDNQRAANKKFGTASVPRLNAMLGVSVEPWAVEWKHTYYLPLDDEMREKIMPLAKPYPKRERSAAGGAAGVQSAGGGSIPTRSLQQATGRTAERV